MYEVRFDKRKTKKIAKLPKEYFERIMTKIRALATDPRTRGCAKLEDNIYRIRVDRYRVIYHIDDQQKTVSIGKVVKRDEKTYRGFG